MPRAIIIVLDSFGIGGAPDAAAYGDEGSNTFGHIALTCLTAAGERAGLRSGALKLPNLDALGLGAAHLAANGRALIGFNSQPMRGIAAAGIEISKGKDTPSGHWEMAGSPVSFEWGYFPNSSPSFPAQLTKNIIREAKLPGILGDCHAPGTTVIEQLGEESLRTGKPILYTSVDSCLQIAAHEQHFGLQRLYDLCKICRTLVDPLRIGRVIARPFLGETSSSFKRTPNRKDFAMPPAPGNILDRCFEAGRNVITIGKIGDIFAHRNTGLERKGKSNDEHVTMAVEALNSAADGSFIFVNLVDFDTEYGHRRDVPGYAAALEAFDKRLPEIEAALHPGDLLIITADHGNDPTWKGTDHTRECVPILMTGLLVTGSRLKPATLGKRETFADIGATIAKHLGIAPTLIGTPMLTA
jgi:phosphopentomutase